MFGTASYRAMGAHYRSIDISSRVEGASPHRLIAILFEELLSTIDAIAAGARAGARKDFQRQSRAMSILHALEASLDHERGGAVAPALAKVYRQARRLLAAGMGDGDVARIAEARGMIAEIADAWNRIG